MLFIINCNFTCYNTVCSFPLLLYYKILLDKVQEKKIIPHFPILYTNIISCRSSTKRKRKEERKSPLGITSLDFSIFYSSHFISRRLQQWKREVKRWKHQCLCNPQRGLFPSQKWLVWHVKLRIFILCLHITCNEIGESLEKQSNKRTTKLFPWYQHG